MQDISIKQRKNKYFDLLKEWNKVHRLTGNIDRFPHNFEDAAFTFTFLDSFNSVLDIGSGSGFPGLVFAIYKPDAKVVLVEPNIKKSSFLRVAKIELGLENVEVVQKKVQDVDALPFDLITSRAVAHTSLLLDWTANLRDSNTKMLLFKGTDSANVQDDRIIDMQTIKNGERIYLYIKESRC